MKSRMSIIAGVLLAGIAMVLWITSRTGSNEQTASESPEHRRGTPPSGSEDATPQAHIRKTREPGIETIDQAEAAMLGFDLDPLLSGNPTESKQCYHRLKRLAASLPQNLYGELCDRLGERSESPLKIYLLRMAIYLEWAKKDLDQAVTDLSEIEDKKLFAKALQNAFTGAAEISPESAMAKAQTLEFPNQRDFEEADRIDLMDSVFDTWIESDPFSAIQWANQAAVPKKRREQWIADGLRAWSKTDPAAAERWSTQDR